MKFWLHFGQTWQMMIAIMSGKLNSMNLSLHPGLADTASEVAIDAVVNVDILLECFQANLKSISEYYSKLF